jgi:hypothetical protein
MPLIVWKLDRLGRHRADFGPAHRQLERRKEIECSIWTQKPILAFESSMTAGWGAVAISQRLIIRPNAASSQESLSDTVVSVPSDGVISVPV